MGGRINVHIETYGPTGSPWVCRSKSLDLWYLNVLMMEDKLCCLSHLCYWSVFLAFDLRKDIWESDKKIKGKVKGSSNLQKKSVWFCVMGFVFILDLLHQKDWKHQGIISLQANSTHILAKGFNWCPHKDLVQYKIWIVS